MERIDFNKNAVAELSYTSNWPYVYILANKEEKTCYVGETTELKSRFNQHLQNSKKSIFNKAYFMTTEVMNKSVILDLESKLIEYISSDEYFVLTNENGGQNHDYFDKYKTFNIFKTIWEYMIEENLSVHKISEIENTDIFKYTPMKALTPEQRYVVEICKKLIENNSERYESVVIQGDAGTGKTVCANVLFYELKNIITKFKTNQTIKYVVGNSTLKKTLQAQFKKIAGLNKVTVCTPYDILNTYKESNFTKKVDYVIIDEAQRMKKRKNLVGWKAFDNATKTIGLDKNECSEMDFIRFACNKMIVFCDLQQTVKQSDMDIEVIEELSKKSTTLSLKLTNQMRVAAGNEYIKFVKCLLQMSNESFDLEKLKSENYEIKCHENFDDFYHYVNSKNKDDYTSLMISGLGFEKTSFSVSKDWKKTKTENAKKECDFVLEGKEIFWNTTPVDWVNSEKVRDENGNIAEFGCIHTMQGQALDYCGVVFSKEIYLDSDGKIKVNKENYSDKKDLNQWDEDSFEKAIKDIYYILLTRGIRGVSIYAVDKKLNSHIKKILKINV
jgi:DUF2075 family protein/predicted GIY-YIG superfamily endonuclease